MEQDFCVYYFADNKNVRETIQTGGSFWCILDLDKKRKGDRPLMLKKLTSLLLSLLLCLSLLPGQTRAACEPDPAGSTVIEESLDLETLEEPVMPLGVEGGEIITGKDDSKQT